MVLQPAHSEDDQRALDVLLRLQQGRALRPPKLGGYKTISARITGTAHSGLQRIAHQLGYVRAGQGNVSLLLEAIGTGTVEVTPLLVRVPPGQSQG